jgi:hypothetical protein
MFLLKDCVSVSVLGSRARCLRNEIPRQRLELIHEFTADGLRYSVVQALQECASMIAESKHC